MERKPGKRQVMSRMKDQHIACAVNWFRHQQRVGGYRCKGAGSRENGGKIVDECICVIVNWVFLASRPGIPRTQIACWIILVKI